MRLAKACFAAALALLLVSPRASAHEPGDAHQHWGWTFLEMGVGLGCIAALVGMVAWIRARQKKGEIDV